jgi:hypothetical protein
MPELPGDDQHIFPKVPVLFHTHRPARPQTIHRYNRQDQSGLQRRPLSKDHAGHPDSLRTIDLLCLAWRRRSLERCLHQVRHPDYDHPLVAQIRSHRDDELRLPQGSRHGHTGQRNLIPGSSFPARQHSWSATLIRRARHPSLSLHINLVLHPVVLHT